MSEAAKGSGSIWEDAFGDPRIEPGAIVVLGVPRSIPQAGSGSKTYRDAVGCRAVVGALASDADNGERRYIVAEGSIGRGYFWRARDMVYLPESWQKALELFWRAGKREFPAVERDKIYEQANFFAADRDPQDSPTAFRLWIVRTGVAFQDTNNCLIFNLRRLAKLLPPELSRDTPAQRTWTSSIGGHDWVCTEGPKREANFRDFKATCGKCQEHVEHSTNRESSGAARATLARQMLGVDSCNPKPKAKALPTPHEWGEVTVSEMPGMWTAIQTCTNCGFESSATNYNSCAAAVAQLEQLTQATPSSCVPTVCQLPCPFQGRGDSICSICPDRPIYRQLRASRRWNGREYEPANLEARPLETSMRTVWGIKK